MITVKEAANAVGGKTARACDGCLRRRARWFCAADDAFLCQACDASVHSANQLASRHERVRLQTSSLKKPKNVERCTSTTDDHDDHSPPAWHQGFKRKARTPRGHYNKLPISVPVVPEIGSEEVESPDACNERHDDHELLYRVPVFVPTFGAELCHEMENTIEDGREKTTMGMKNEVETVEDDDLDDLHEFLSLEMELAGFGADVESLLGEGLDDGNDLCIDVGEGRVKVEDQEDHEILEEAAIVACGDQLNPLMVENMRSETLDWKFDYELQQFAGDEDEEIKVTPMAEKETMCGKGSSCEEEMKRKDMFLRLNYEEVIKAWAGQGCPWTTGTRPELNPDKYCWPDFMEEAHDQPAYGVGENHVGWRRDHEGREARVSRYREKRRTRLFSKKIRYQVRKLNADKRPRMKGRFVKRTSCALYLPHHGDS